MAKKRIKRRPRVLKLLQKKRNQLVKLLLKVEDKIHTAVHKGK